MSAPNLLWWAWHLCTSASRFGSKEKQIYLCLNHRIQLDLYSVCLFFETLDDQLRSCQHSCQHFLNEQFKRKQGIDIAITAEQLME